MKRSVGVIVMLMLIVSFTSLGQVQKFTFGKIAKEDLEMKVYPLDSGASAVYLLNKGETSLRGSDLACLVTVHVRVKILNEEGLDRADIELRYLKGDADITKLKAITHNLIDGRVVSRKVGKKEWVDEKINGSLRAKKLSFPDANVGSVIEYSFVREIGNIVNLPSWTFQQSIPIRYSEYKVELSPYASYIPIMKGSVSPSHKDTKDDKFHVVLEDVPALTKEPYVSTIENFRAGIEFETRSSNIPGNRSRVYIKDWGVVNRRLMASDRLGGAIKRTGPLRKIYPEDKGWGNDKESLIEIYNYVRDHFTWNGRSAYRVVDSGKELWKEAEGDNADINITLAQFLMKAGIQANPVILSTRGNGYTDKLLPVTSQFNYLILQVTIDDETVLVDATDKFRPYNILPERAMNGAGLLLKNGEPEWVSLRKNNESNSKTTQGVFAFNEDMELTGDMEVDFRSIAASRIRAELFEEMKKEAESASEPSESAEENDALDEYKTGEVENLKVFDLTDPMKGLKVKYNFTMSEGINMIGDKIFMSPVLLKHVSENPFKLEKRLYPVEISAPINDTYSFKITIPEGYDVEELPKSQVLSLPNKGGKYMYNVGRFGDEIQVMVRLSLSQTAYSTEYYPYLKELFNIILSKQDEQIVFKQKSE